MAMFKLELCSPRWPGLAKLATKAYALALMAMFKLGVLLQWYHMHVHSRVASCVALFMLFMLIVFVEVDEVVHVT